ncbi:MAG: hypothetical protein NC417_04405 [Candidatus Gastranaerophilales bacterium]|nr:hypothetical protein [Candidatus Gastranaerophilales bacterium]
MRKKNNRKIVIMVSAVCLILAIAAWVVIFSLVSRQEVTVMNWYAIGAGVGLMVGIVLVVLIFALTKKGRSVKSQYDERQELVRGRGAKYGFYTLLISNAVIGVMEIADLSSFAEKGVLMIIGCLPGICVYAVYCIWYDGYFALNESRRRIMASLAIIGISNFLIGAMNLVRGVIVQNGRLTVLSLNLFCAFLFIVIFAAMFLKKVCKDGKEEQL